MRANDFFSLFFFVYYIPKDTKDVKLFFMENVLGKNGSLWKKCLTTAHHALMVAFKKFQSSLTTQKFVPLSG